MMLFFIFTQIMEFHFIATFLFIGGNDEIVDRILTEIHNLDLS